MRKRPASATPSRCAFRLAAVMGICFTFAAQAGDILRGGAPAGSPGRGASRGGGMNAGIARARVNAKDSLARTTQALQSVKAMQDAARAAAIKGPNRLGANLPNVPNGLGVGGLQVAPGVPANLASPQPGENPALWTGANLPKQKVANGHTTVTIEQLKQQALLTWQTFNIGKETTLKFDQSKGGKDAGKWIAFNKVEDPTGVPSQILGSIKAQGQVYFINQNGIIFGGSSQVNVHGLVASSLPINDNLLQRGILNNPDEQFLFSSLAIPQLSSGAQMPAFTPPAAPNTPDGKQGDVVVQAGAKITAPTNADHVGGRIALIGPNVKNAGTISTPDGQTILAAGQQVGFRAHASTDATLRGLDVSIGAVDEGSGTATNSGLIDAPRANATMAGKNVRQLGAIDSTTSVDLNGRIDLLANYGSTVSLVTTAQGNKPILSPRLTGIVTLGEGSVTRILPELLSEDTVVGTQLALNSQVNIQGLGIHLDENAAVLAPSAAVSFRAGTWQPNTQSGSVFTFDKGQIHLDAGAFVNVAGTIDVAASITQNIISLEMRGSELADSPLQRGGPLRGPLLYLDMRKTGTFNGFAWVGTPLGNASGYLGLIERTVAQLTVAGGSVKFNAGESVVMQPGSLIDVSGGWTNFDGGLVNTTRVLAGGQLIDIANATPNRVYDGLYTGTFTSTHTRWGIDNIYSHPIALTGAHYEPDYTQGANAGSVEIVAPSVALDGTLRGNTISGERQRAAEPVSASLFISFQAQDSTKTLLPAFSPTPPSVVFTSTSTLAPADDFALDPAGAPLLLRADRKASVELSPALLSEQGFSRFTLDNRDGNISVPAGVTLAVAPGGSIKLDGANVSIAGALIAPAGTLSIGAYNISPFAAAELQTGSSPVTPPPNAGRGVVTLAPGAVLSAAGLIVDDRPVAEERNHLPLLLNGGAITINSYSAQLARGSVIDASGGVVLSATGRATYGSGGSISIKAGQDPTIGSVLGGKLTLGSALSAFSGGKGGALSIHAPAIQIGGTTSRAGTLLLAPEFFSTGGFTSFTLTGLGAATAQADEFVPGVFIAPGTLIEPEVRSWLAMPHTPNYDGITLRPIVRPEALRPAVSISFNAPGVRDTFNSSLFVVRGDFVLGEGALVNVGARGSVTVRSDTATVLGGIAAPGGSISITGGSTFAASTPPTNPLATVFLGPQSVLTTAGTTLLTPDVRGFRTGVVLPGGSISVSGNVVASAGAVLDVSGASGVLDTHPAFLGLAASLDETLQGQVIGAPLIPVSSGLTSPLYNFGLVVPTRRDSDAGSISLKGGQMLFTDATLLGAAGGPGALGGKLSISSGKFIPPGDNTPQTPLDVTLVVTQSAPTIPKAITGIGQSVLAGDGSVLPGRGYFAVDRFIGGGFDALTLGGTVQFIGPVTIDARRSLAIADGGVIFADSAVKLSAPYVALGTAFRPPILPEQPQAPFTVAGQPYNFLPTHGPGSLTVHAQLIDIGNLSLQNIGRASFFADGGDIRGDGTLDVAGDILLRAAQIYPPSAVSFTIAASDYVEDGATVSGSVTIVGVGERQLPMSAGGQLSIYGSIINQGGTLRAPLGTINLGWDGTGTAPVGAITGQAVASTEQLTLASGSVISVSAIDPGTGAALILPYGIDLNGVSWIDPSGQDITAGGAPQKKVNLSAVSIDSQAGSLIDVRGGGDLYSYRWIQGIGGSTDILASTTSFAILPGYDASYMPYAPFNPSTLATNLGGDPGYVNSTLSVGDRIFLGKSDGLDAGTYTLLPARYALLPGAFLVTPKSGTPVGTFNMPDGSSIVSGYRVNTLNASREGELPFARFEVIRGGIVRERAEYGDFLANYALAQSARRLGIAPPRLPSDSGKVVLQATQALTLQGAVQAQAIGTGRGGLVDISSPLDILIAGPGATGNGSQLVLNAANLSTFGAESLFIGGVRQDNGAVTVKTGNITVDNAAAALTGPEIILAANQNLTLAPGAIVQQRGSFSGADTLTLTGDGVLLRVSGDASAQTVRTGITPSTTPLMTIGAGAQIAGASVTLDSTSGTSLDPTAAIRGRAISLNSGRISVQLDNPGALEPTTGLVLAGNALQGLRSADVLSLLSYSSLDLYGTGSFEIDGRLELHAGEIRGFNNGGGTVTLGASDVLLDNRANVASPGAIAAPAGTLAIDADTVRLGVNQLRIDQFANVSLTASGGILGEGAGGLTVQGSLTATAPVITAAKQSTQSITAGGALVLARGGEAKIEGGLGASLALQGASVSADTDILLPSGLLTLRATGGDVSIGGTLDVGGTARTFYDLVKFTDAGRITLTSDTGSVNVLAGAVLNVAAASGGGDAGALAISAAQGSFTSAGTINGQAGQGGSGGGFALDTGSLASFSALGASLTGGGFTQEQSFRVRTGDVLIDGTAAARTFRLSADQGAITVSGVIDASGATGGSISLMAGGNVTLLAGSELTVAAQDFNNAGKGGNVALESRAGTIDVQTGSTIDLSVASNAADSADFGKFTGTLHLRAAQNAGATDLNVNAINGTISGASRITVEGFKVFDLTGTGTITTAVQTDVMNNGNAFAANTAAITARLLAGNAVLDPATVITPGAEIINTTGSLTLGTTSSTATSDWNLATFRFGPKNAAGVLTLRAAQNITLFNAISDGFATSAYDSQLLAPNALLPVNAQSWSYRFTAGADFGAANFRAVVAGTGSLRLGKNAGTAIAVPFGNNALTSQAVGNRFQVIRTGSGDIDIHAGTDVQLLNQFASIYTAGTRVADATVLPGGTFDVPILNANGGQGVLGAIQQPVAYPAQYTLAGGNVTISAGSDIAHLTRVGGVTVADSQRAMPTNWLYRRSYVDPLTGEFGSARFGDAASTTWWVDFSNFFQGVGALGGGNVTMTAGRDVSNVDAVIPTNARMPEGAPDASKLVELGGGDLVVRAGRDLDAGTYYIERGKGTLTAGGSIKTNSTRSPSLTIITGVAPLAAETWLPTTLFLGKGSYDVSARGDALLGPVANPFMLPGGYNNTFWYKTYFSTYAPDNAVEVSSLGGSVTMRESVTMPTVGTGGDVPILQAWYENVLLLKAANASFYQPWLRLNETSTAPFATASSLMPATLRATAFSGDVNLIGNLTLSPAPRGTIDLAAAGAINGLQVNGQTTISGAATKAWGTSRINLSDANPDSIPGITSALAYQTVAGNVTSVANTTGLTFLVPVDALFAESGSTSGAQAVLQTKQALHAPGVLHTGDPDPVRLYALGGDIADLTLFSGKSARVIAERDITDIALYVQNVAADDITLVSAGRDIVAYNDNSPFRVTARSTGNALNTGEAALAGDIQISGPGTLEVLAGRNLDLGVGPNNTDGTALGIVSIGNARNPFLPFDGASIIAGAGLGAAATGLSESGLDFERFISEVLTADKLDTYLAELNAPGVTSANFDQLPDGKKAQLAIEMFYLVLRDAGRDEDYDAGFAAIDTLFPGSAWQGDISLTSRGIKTRSGGSISLFAPGGMLTVGFDVSGGQALDQGILTEAGGGISIFTDGDVIVGTSRIFTLRGGDEILWSSNGDIAAGASAKTVQSAPPTRVLIDPQSGDVQTDLAGLATGGGIGVLATVAGVPPGDVDLIAPNGAIDAGDAGIRVSGNLNLAAPTVLNASNIATGGSTSGAPSTGGAAVSAPVTSVAPSTAATNTAAQQQQAATQQRQEAPTQVEEQPSIISVEVIGYGGGDPEEEERRRRQQQ